MVKVIFYFIVIIYCIVTFSKTIHIYQKDKSVNNVMEIIARILLIPSGIILLIYQFIGWFIKLLFKKSIYIRAKNRPYIKIKNM